MDLELFPSGQSQPLSDLQRYRRQARRPLNRWILIVVVALFAGSIAMNFLDEGDPEYATWSMLRSADADLTIAREAESWPAWACCLADLESERETLEDIIEEMTRHQAKGILTSEGEEELEQMRLLLSQERSGESEEELLVHH